MLGYLVGITLLLTVLAPFLVTDVFADSFTANFDKSQYDYGDKLVISGEIIDFKMPIIAMSIYDPDGKILSANNLEISSQKTFEKTISLESPFYEKPGEYLVKFDYGQTTQNYNFVLGNDPISPEIFFDNPADPEIVLLYTEKKQYTDKDVIVITGLVSALDSPTVLIGVYDPFGMPAGFYFGAVDSNLEFSTSFLVKSGVNFRVDGTYSIKAHYAGTDATSFFDYYEVLPIINDKEPIKTIDETINTIPEETIDETINTIPEETIDETINTIPEETIDETINTIPEETIETKITKEKQDVIPTNNESDSKNNSKEITKEKIKKQTNLTVEDIELGKQLNQINLKCDSSTFTDTISYYDGMGPALYRLCKFDSSLNFFNKSLIDNPDDVEILVNKGSALGKLGYFSEAIVYYDYALNIDSSFLPAKNNKANALANMGNLDDAIAIYYEILDENPNYITTKKNLQIALSKNSQTVNMTEPVENNLEENSVQMKSLKPIQNELSKLEKQNTKNFFEEVNLAFSSLGSLFGLFH